jgi:hypothetical protein
MAVPQIQAAEKLSRERRCRRSAVIPRAQPAAPLTAPYPPLCQPGTSFNRVVPCCQPPLHIALRVFETRNPRNTQQNPQKAAGQMPRSVHTGAALRFTLVLLAGWTSAFNGEENDTQCDRRCR